MPSHVRSKCGQSSRRWSHRYCIGNLKHRTTGLRPILMTRSPIQTHDHRPRSLFLHNRNNCDVRTSGCPDSDVSQELLQQLTALRISIHQLSLQSTTQSNTTGKTNDLSCQNFGLNKPAIPKENNISLSPTIRTPKLEDRSQHTDTSDLSNSRCLQPRVSTKSASLKCKTSVNLKARHPPLNHGDLKWEGCGRFQNRKWALRRPLISSTIPSSSPNKKACSTSRGRAPRRTYFKSKAQQTELQKEKRNQNQLLESTFLRTLLNGTDFVKFTANCAQSPCNVSGHSFNDYKYSSTHKVKPVSGRDLQSASKWWMGPKHISERSSLKYENGAIKYNDQSTSFDNDQARGINPTLLRGTCYENCRDYIGNEYLTDGLNGLRQMNSSAFFGNPQLARMNALEETTVKAPPRQTDLPIRFCCDPEDTGDSFVADYVNDPSGHLYKSVSLAGGGPIRPKELNRDTKDYVRDLSRRIDKLESLCGILPGPIGAFQKVEPSDQYPTDCINDLARNQIEVKPFGSARLTERRSMPQEVTYNMYPMDNDFISEPPQVKEPSVAFDGAESGIMSRLRKLCNNFCSRHKSNQCCSDLSRLKDPLFAQVRNSQIVNVKPSAPGKESSEIPKDYFNDYMLFGGAEPASIKSLGLGETGSVCSRVYVNDQLRHYEDKLMEFADAPPTVIRPTRPEEHIDGYLSDNSRFMGQMSPFLSNQSAGERPLGLRRTGEQFSSDHTYSPSPCIGVDRSTGKHFLGCVGTRKQYPTDNINETTRQKSNLPFPANQRASGIDSPERMSLALGENNLSVIIDSHRKNMNSSGISSINISNLNQYTSGRQLQYSDGRHDILEKQEFLSGNAAHISQQHRSDSSKVYTKTTYTTQSTGSSHKAVPGIPSVSSGSIDKPNLDKKSQIYDNPFQRTVKCIFGKKSKSQSKVSQNIQVQCECHSAWSDTDKHNDVNNQNTLKQQSLTSTKIADSNKINAQTQYLSMQKNGFSTTEISGDSSDSQHTYLGKANRTQPSGSIKSSLGNSNVSKHIPYAEIALSNTRCLKFSNYCQRATQTSPSLSTRTLPNTHVTHTNRSRSPRHKSPHKKKLVKNKSYSCPWPSGKSSKHDVLICHFRRSPNCSSSSTDCRIRSNSRQMEEEISCISAETSGTTFVTCSDCSWKIRYQKSNTSRNILLFNNCSRNMQNEMPSAIDCECLEETNEKKDDIYCNTVSETESLKDAHQIDKDSDCSSNVLVQNDRAKSYILPARGLLLPKTPLSRVHLYLVLKASESCACSKKKKSDSEKNSSISVQVSKGRTHGRGTVNRDPPSDESFLCTNCIPEHCAQTSTEACRPPPSKSANAADPQLNISGEVSVNSKDKYELSPSSEKVLLAERSITVSNITENRSAADPQPNTVRNESVKNIGKYDRSPDSDNFPPSPKPLSKMLATDSKLKSQEQENFIETKNQSFSENSPPKKSIKTNSKLKSESEAENVSEKDMCECFYPPAFKQFSCAASRLGQCSCNARRYS